MRTTLAFVLLTLCVPGIGSAQKKTAAMEKAAVMAPIRRFVDEFNKGDNQTAAADCASVTSILDEFPPHEWHGAGACTQWMSDFDADAKKNGITDEAVTLGTPRHVQITADRAYVVVPANYTYKQHGRPVKEIGSVLTVALQKAAAGWQMVGWAWAER